MMNLYFFSGVHVKRRQTADLNPEISRLKKIYPTLLTKLHPAL